ncbi:tetratricopeptide repeat protein [Oceanibacterium hippocampi]|uniref:Sel1 repeat protein n=1 Tax=Oceanibacterium hippocampi TaxID=745714 RepID=A0A1Y5U2H3_9PROT|nr:SEL1-like repeat protein [Oceanibacterium hippocampi]SLN77047.1 Sel1 repeat protein [Oceanibacterium hippocampi]
MTPVARSDIRNREKAALRGEPTAQFDLGLMYSTGQGVPVDMITAHKWFNIAAMAGFREARELRSELARDMTPREIAEAQRLAREWYLSH